MCGFFFNKKFLNNIYSYKIEKNRVRYNVLGFKISIKNKINIEETRKDIEKNILKTDVEYVSFDIFDTLLVRPAIFPTDIFALIAEKVNKLYNIDFYEMRLNAERNNINANIFQLYNYIKEKYGLNDDLKDSLLNEEIEVVSRLLSPREDIKEIYDLAVSGGKKIIAVSDTVYPSELLLKILHDKGYMQIARVFVSNEYNARKSNENFFDIVRMQLKTKSVLYIGEDFLSDFKKGINAVYYPKIADILSCNTLLSSAIKKLKNDFPEDVNKNVYIGFILNNYWFNHNSNSEKLFDDLADFTNLYLAPYLCFISFSIQKNPIIRSLYKKIYFISRDGYLPKKIYDILNDGEYPISEYIYGSRIAYWTGIYSSVYDLLKQQQPFVNLEYTFEDFINAYFSDKS